MVGGLGLFAAFAAILVVVGADEEKSARIVGGTEATVGEFPYQVSIEMNGEHVCGGAIIGERHIATAAHCVSTVSDLSRIAVVTGSIFRGPGYGQRHAVRQALYHQEYQFTNGSPGDIAALVLASPIIFNQNQNYIRIASGPTPTNGVGTVTGWGYRNVNIPIGTGVLQKLNAYTLAAAECSTRLNQLSQYVQRRQIPTIWNCHICTNSSPGQGTCHLDSGGPLVYGGELIGIVSFGIPCGKGYPDVFTSTYFYQSWLQSILTTT